MKFPSENKCIFEYATASKSASKLGSVYFDSKKYTEYEVAYKEAGDKLVDKALEDGSLFQEVSIYPIVFLYRQFIELYIKDLLLKYSNDFLYDKKILSSHDLYQLWGVLLSLIKNSFNDLPSIYSIELFDGLTGADSYIAELSLVDRKSMAFRYPDDKTHTKQYFQNELSVDLVNIKDRVEELANLFVYLENILGIVKVDNNKQGDNKCDSPNTTTKTP